MFAFLLSLVSLIVPPLSPTYGGSTVSAAPHSDLTTELESQVFVVTMPDGYLMEAELIWPKHSVGLPIHLMIHGGGGSRLVPRSDAMDLARLGFVTALIDMPGQGPSVNRNFPGPPNQDFGSHFTHELTQLYLATVVEEIRRSFTPMASQSDLSISGTSQGSIHSLISAAMSGRPYSDFLVQKGYVKPGQTFPVVRAVSCTSFGPNLASQFFPQGRTYSMRLLDVVYRPSDLPPWDWRKGLVQGTWISPSSALLLRTLIEGKTAAEAVVQLSATDGYTYMGHNGRMRADLIASKTHIDLTLAADDGWRGLGPAIDVLALRDTPGVFTFLSVDDGGGHRAPEVPGEVKLRQERRAAFLTAAVLGDTSRLQELDLGQGQIYQELKDLPAVTWSLAPPELGVYWNGPAARERVIARDWKSLRSGSVWPQTPFFLLPKHRLGEKPSSAAESSTIIRQVWTDMTYGWQEILEDISGGEVIVGQRLIGSGNGSIIQWSSAEFLNQLNRGMNIAGPGHSRVYLKALPGDFQLNVGLFHSADRGKNWRHITSGSMTVLDYPGGESMHEIPLNPGAYGPLRKGEILRVSIIPTAVHRADYPEFRFGEIEHAPLIGHHAVQILHDKSHPSSVWIPTFPLDQVILDE